MISLLADFTIDWSAEWLGIIASVLILVSFLFTKQVITRLINMVGCLAFVIYATVFINSFSTAFMNGALFVVHVIYLVKDYLARKKKQNLVEVSADKNTTLQVNAQQDSSANESTKEK